MGVVTAPHREAGDTGVLGSGRVRLEVTPWLSSAGRQCDETWRRRRLAEKGAED